MLGALGKMKETSSNLLRRRQFSARKILRIVSTYVMEATQQNYSPSCARVAEPMGDDDGRSVLLERRDNEGCSSGHVFEHMWIVEILGL